MSQLKNIVRFVGVGAGLQATLPHGLDIDGVAIIPDFVVPNNGAFSIVAVTATDVTVENGGGAAANCDVLAEHWHTYERAFGPVSVFALAPQPFIAAGSGGSAASLNQAYDAGRVVTVDAGAVVLNQSGASNALEVNQSGAGDAIAVALATNLTNQALVVTEDNVIRTSPMAEFTRQALATGDVIRITNAGAGLSLNVVSGDAAFGGNVQLGVGQELAFDDDGNTHITATANDVLRIRTGALTMMTFLGATAVARVDQDLEIDGDLNHDGTNVGLYGAVPVPQSAAYTRNAVVVEDRTLLASASATTVNNNNVLAALIADFQAIGILG